ncbi:MAG: hypothetical protein RIS17_767 [Pseudomonadota bacterium]
MVAAALAALVADRARYAGIATPRLALFLAFQHVWEAADPGLVAGDETLPARAAHARLADIAPLARQALLLGVMEDFTTAEIALLIERSADDVAALIGEARRAIAAQAATDVLIIEDEPIIAMDIEAIVTGMGHGVIGIASTQREAAALARQRPVGLLLADIHLRDGSSGIDAVRDIRSHTQAPAIFITGNPDLLSTGQGPEPTFLIAKPFAASRVHAAIAQALFFAGRGHGHG